MHLVDDRHVRSRVAAALAVLERGVGARTAAVGELVEGVVPAVVARVREADIAGLVAPAVLVTSGGRLELRRLLVALPALLLK